jgi:enoyl-CoA hydratase/carnithine racemase
MNPDPELSALQITKTDDGITIITLNRPARRNAVDPATARKLRTALLAFEDDSTQKVAILCGANGTFCAGFDLQKLSKSQPTDNDEVAANTRPVQGRNHAPMGPSRMQLRKPLISAVSGFAVAGGLELSLLADLRVVEEDAVFGVFCRRFGVPLVDGGTVRLQRVVGFGRAMDMVLTGREVAAGEALGMGLANRVVPKGKALEEAVKLAREIARFPQVCMNADRASCYYAAYEAGGFEDAMRNEFEGGTRVMREESVPGAARFAAGEGRHGGSGKEKL